LSYRPKPDCRGRFRAAGAPAGFPARPTPPENVVARPRQSSRPTPQSLARCPMCGGSQAALTPPTLTTSTRPRSPAGRRAYRHARHQLRAIRTGTRGPDEYSWWPARGCRARRRSDPGPSRDSLVSRRSAARGTWFSAFREPGRYAEVAHPILAPNRRRARRPWRGRRGANSTHRSARGGFSAPPVRCPVA